VFAAFPLEGSRVRLEPLTLKHLPGLMAVATGDRSSFAFEYVPDNEAILASYVKTGLGAPDQYPFAVVDVASSTVLGSVRFMSIERWDGPFRDGLFPNALEIGGLWLSPAATALTVLEVYSLMFAEVFDEWQSHRVTIRVDTDDEIRRAVIEQTGATLDGVLRGQQLPFGRKGPRSTASFSILRAEWSGIKKALAKKL
jgi:N-acetyltransferase